MNLFRGIAILIALIGASAAQAADSVMLASEVFVEKIVTGSDGRPQVLLQQPKRVMPGDDLVFVLKYRNAGQAPAKNFSVTNPLPRAVSFRETTQKSAVYSVDGGRIWGALPALQVRADDGRLRLARPDDVTHVRWTFRQPLPAGASGKLSFRGTVR
jgi:uncharacterized repeat protein (TIGR01451 family)